MKKSKKRAIDWEFIRHTIVIICKDFKKADEAIEILKQEGIYKGRKLAND